MSVTLQISPLKRSGTSSALQERPIPFGGNLRVAPDNESKESLKNPFLKI